jgi:hypothetical protein
MVDCPNAGCLHTGIGIGVVSKSSVYPLVGSGGTAELGCSHPGIGLSSKTVHNRNKQTGKSAEHSKRVHFLEKEGDVLLASSFSLIARVLLDAFIMNACPLTHHSNDRLIILLSNGGQIIEADAFSKQEAP